MEKSEYPKLWKPKVEQIPINRKQLDAIACIVISITEESKHHIRKELDIIDMWLTEQYKALQDNELPK